MEALTPIEIAILHEIYGVPLVPQTVYAALGSGGLAISPASAFINTSLKTQLLQAVATINGSSAYVLRVREVLEVYATFSLDPSTINKDGYEFRAGNSMRSVLNALYPYTGITLVAMRSSNKMQMG